MRLLLAGLLPFFFYIIVHNQDDLTTTIGVLRIKVINNTFIVYVITNNPDIEKMENEIKI